MATSDLTNSQVGDKDSTVSIPKSKHAQSLPEITDELAEILVLYQKAGGDVAAITLANQKEIFGTQHVLILPADKIGNTYSLRSQNDAV